MGISSLSEIAWVTGSQKSTPPNRTLIKTFLSIRKMRLKAKILTEPKVTLSHCF